MAEHKYPPINPMTAKDIDVIGKFFNDYLSGNRTCTSLGYQLIQHVWLIKDLLDRVDCDNDEQAEQDLSIAHNQRYTLENKLADNDFGEELQELWQGYVQQVKQLLSSPSVTVMHEAKAQEPHEIFMPAAPPPVDPDEFGYAVNAEQYSPRKIYPAPVACSEEDRRAYGELLARIKRENSDGPAAYHHRPRPTGEAGPAGPFRR